MPSSNTKSVQAARQRRAVLLQKVPDGTTRIQVKDIQGKLRYRALDQLADDDVIQVKKDGSPVVMKGKPGRKQPVNLGPNNDVIKEILKRKGEALDEDAILKALKANPDSPDVLHQVIAAIGEEAASMGFERAEAERKGDSTIAVSSKRVVALRSVADTWLKRQEQLAERTIDLDSPGFKVLFRYIMDTFREAMTSTNLRPEQVDTVFARLSTLLSDEWEAEAKNRMKRGR